MIYLAVLDLCQIHMQFHSCPRHALTGLYYNSFIVENTELFINATRRAVDKFSANVSAFVAENTRIIEEIDTIIASLGDIHTRINMVIMYYVSV